MIEDTIERLLEKLENRYYGKFRGYVYDVKDEEKLGRIKAKVPRLLGDTPTSWALPSAPYAGPDQGLFTVPEIGAGVWIEFEEGDLSRPIWSGMWWGKPTEDQIQGDGKPPAEHPRGESEVPQHQLKRPPEGPGYVAEPNVRILKSATGHHIVMDDRPGKERLEIQDAHGNRIIMDRNGVRQITGTHTERNRGNRTVTVTQDETRDTKRNQTVLVKGTQTQVVDKDAEHRFKQTRKASVDAADYVETIDGDGVRQESSGEWYSHHGGRIYQESGGAMELVAGKGYALTSSRGLVMSSMLGIDIATTFPAIPSLNAVSINALVGNISLNTKLGMLQLGGMTAVSPMVLGDGVMIQNTMLAAISAGFNPLTAMGYGPAMASWAAATMPLSLSLFGYVKRFPFG